MTFRRVWFALMVAASILLISQSAWSTRNICLDGDAVSYLDIADDYLHGNTQGLSHPYWSPLYPVLLAIALKVFSPAPEFIFDVAHLANWLIALCALAGFIFLLREWLHLRMAGAESNAGFCVLTLFALTLFLWSTVRMIGFVGVKPDLCVAAIVYVAAGLCCRISVAAKPRGDALILGIVLGIGYAAKAAMLPLGLVVLGLLAVEASRRKRWSPVPLAALGLAAVVAPFICMVSLRVHRLSIGEQGRLNYAWMVAKNVPQAIGWTAGNPDEGTPVHPPEVLNLNPLVLEFRNTIGGTYPLWYNPAWFYEGVRVKFNLRNQLAVLKSSAKIVLSLDRVVQMELLCGFALIGALSLLGRHRLRLNLWLMLWPISAFALYALVVMEARYVGAFWTLFWLAVCDSVYPQKPARAQIGVLALMALCIGLPEVREYVRLVSHNPSGQPDSLAVPREISRMGLHAGDEIAIVGAGSQPCYAKLAGLRITALVFEPDPFRILSGAGLAALEEKIARTHARAIMHRNCRDSNERGWFPIGGNGYCVQMLK